jgi:hypothetical protein
VSFSSLKFEAILQGQRTFGNEASKSRKQEAIQNDVAALEMALDSAKAEFQKIATRNREVGPLIFRIHLSTQQGRRVGSKG